MGRPTSTICQESRGLFYHAKTSDISDPGPSRLHLLLRVNSPTLAVCRRIFPRHQSTATLDHVPGSSRDFAAGFDKMVPDDDHPNLIYAGVADRSHVGTHRGRARTGILRSSHHWGTGRERAAVPYWGRME